MLCVQVFMGGFGKPGEAKRCSFKVNVYRNKTRVSTFNINFIDLELLQVYLWVVTTLGYPFHVAFGVRPESISRLSNYSKNFLTAEDSRGML